MNTSQEGNDSFESLLFPVSQTTTSEPDCLPSGKSNWDVFEICSSGVAYISFVFFTTFKVLCWGVFLQCRSNMAWMRKSLQERLQSHRSRILRHQEQTAQKRLQFLFEAVNSFSKPNIFRFKSFSSGDRLPISVISSAFRRHALQIDNVLKQSVFFPAMPVAYNGDQHLPISFEQVCCDSSSSACIVKKLRSCDSCLTASFFVAYPVQTSPEWTLHLN